MDDNLGLRYLEKKEVDSYLDDIFFTSLKLFKEFDGEICSICKTKQGFPYKGWEKFYCEHTEEKVNNRLKEHHEEALKRLGIFISKFA
ncbi:MAG TPA: hypothetical protein ENH46_05535 [Candidatus Pacearchaeota archaeon]|nr:hypothetical protein [Candidatus Pacearchaeota archaeon]